MEIAQYVYEMSVAGGVAGAASGPSGRLFTSPFQMTGRRLGAVWRVCLLAVHVSVGSSGVQSLRVSRRMQTKWAAGMEAPLILSSTTTQRPTVPPGFLEKLKTKYQPPSCSFQGDHFSVSTTLLRDYAHEICELHKLLDKHQEELQNTGSVYEALTKKTEEDRLVALEEAIVPLFVETLHYRGHFFEADSGGVNADGKNDMVQMIKVFRKGLAWLYERKLAESGSNSLFELINNVFVEEIVSKEHVGLDHSVTAYGIFFTVKDEYSNAFFWRAPKITLHGKYKELKYTLHMSSPLAMDRGFMRYFRSEVWSGERSQWLEAFCAKLFELLSSSGGNSNGSNPITDPTVEPLRDRLTHFVSHLGLRHLYRNGNGRLVLGLLNVLLLWKDMEPVTFDESGDLERDVLQKEVFSQNEGKPYPGCRDAKREWDVANDWLWGTRETWLERMPDGVAKFWNRLNALQNFRFDDGEDVRGAVDELRDRIVDEAGYAADFLDVLGDVLGSDGDAWRYFGWKEIRKQWQRVDSELVEKFGGALKCSRIKDHLEDLDTSIKQAANRIENKMKSYVATKKASRSRTSLKSEDCPTDPAACDYFDLEGKLLRSTNQIKKAQLEEHARPVVWNLECSSASHCEGRVIVIGGGKSSGKAGTENPVLVDYSGPVEVHNVVGGDIKILAAGQRLELFNVEDANISAPTFGEVALLDSERNVISATGSISVATATSRSFEGINLRYSNENQFFCVPPKASMITETPDLARQNRQNSRFGKVAEWTSFDNKFGSRKPESDLKQTVDESLGNDGGFSCLIF